MRIVNKWMNDHKFGIALIAFGLMLLPPIGMYYAAQQNATDWIWGLLAVVVVGNLIACQIK